MADRYAVFGNPVAHSKSPQIHAAFADQTGQSLRYTTVEAPEDDFAGAWQRFVQDGGRGANVTVPFKGDAFALSDTLSHRAQRAGAVNTLIMGGNGRTYGDNTDGIGLARDLAHHEVTLKGKRVLMVGAGGAVRGVLAPLLAESPRELMIANRTAAKAVALAEAFADAGQVSGGGLEDIDGAFDVVINGSSASLSGDMPPLPDGLFAAGASAYDMMYGAEPTVFLRWAEARGARTIDGLGMLVEQAAESFFLWRSVRPDTTAVRASLRQALADG
ncbi:shikimate dehydrogenase [Vreelandella jeotgali]|uniref:shikimate dehydrogenase n=1 Tax=Vreelandella jeotgali TaxID=553386 RepID=UPI000349CB86|nr:shikimate dehydrogenase [Halomonas jeotgali]